VADMVSDGVKFRLAVYWPDNHKQFLLGSNAGRYRRVVADTTSTDPAVRRAGTLANMRPQHLSAAFLVQPLDLDEPGTVYYTDDVRQAENQTRPGGKGSREVVRTYTVLTVLRLIEGSPEASVVRRFWFDRCSTGTPLARQDLYEDGQLATVVVYERFETLPSGQQWPGRVSIERVQDAYSVDVVFATKQLDLNGEVPETAFVLDNEEHLREVDLDTLPEAVRPNGPVR
jgi:hypothetical protein